MKASEVGKAQTERLNAYSSIIILSDPILWSVSCFSVGAWCCPLVPVAPVNDQVAPLTVTSVQRANSVAF